MEFWRWFDFKRTGLKSYIFEQFVYGTKKFYGFINFNGSRWCNRKRFSCNYGKQIDTGRTYRIFHRG